MISNKIIRFLHCLLQDGRIDYSEFVAMMQDTGFGSKIQTSISMGLKVS